MRSAEGDIGLALVRLDALEEAQASDTPLAADQARLTPIKPDWLVL